MPTTARTQSISHAKRIAQRFDGITGVDFGYVYEDGKRSSRQGIRFHVARKRSPADIAASQALPDQIHGIECDVLEARYTVHAAGAGGAAGHLLRPGVSVGNATRRTTGTLGMVVQDLIDGGACLLSNWHVLAGHPDARPSEDIIQPGAGSMGPGDPPNKVAELLRYTNLAHGADAAVARLVGDQRCSNRIQGRAVILSGSVEPTLGMKLVKMGLASGFTHAVVDGVEGSYPIDYSGFGDQTRWIDGVHLVPDPAHPDDEVTLDGDSGAIWFEEATGRVAAINVAGEDGVGPLAEYAVAQPIHRIWELLNVSEWQEAPMAVSFAADIRPLFRPIDVQHMAAFGVRLADYAYMSDPAGDHRNARTVQARLTGEQTPRMPTGGPYWSSEQLALYQRWRDDGYQP